MGRMLRWVDASRYQVERSNPLDLAKARDAGHSIVNVSLTGGRGYVSGAWAKSYLDAAALLDMGRSCYHWLDGRTPGALQAATQLTRMAQLFGKNLGGFAHCVDIEETGEHGITPPGRQTVRDYIDAVQQALGRHVVAYTGDWWWRPRGWDITDLTPYLMAQPNTGKLPAPPNPDDPAWVAGYGGWGTLSVMQWGVAPLPGTGDCSLSVIRDPAVWTAITGGAPVAWENVPASQTLLAEFNEVAPNRDKASDGSIGNGEHAESVSDHNPDETGNTGGVEDPDHINEVHARDVDSSGPWPAGWNMERFVQLILARCRSGQEQRLRYIIYNRRIWSASNGWREQAYTGANAHTQHAHFSFKYGSGAAPANPEQIKTPYGIVAAVRATQEDEVSEADVIAALRSTAGQGALQTALFGTATGRDKFREALLTTNVRAEVLPNEPALALGSALHTMFVRSDSTENRRLPDLDADVAAARAAILAAITAAQATIVTAVNTAPGGSGGQTPITVTMLADAFVLAMKRTFGDQGSAFLAAMRSSELVGEDEQR